ncbi:site-specific integrase [Anaerovoracaceae bacterium 42-11]
MSRRAKGEGSIYKRGDGRWTASYIDDNGNRRYIYGQTKTEVSKRLKRKKVDGTVQHEMYSLQDWVKLFLDTYKKNELKITTYNSYCMFCRVHIEGSSVGKKKLDKLKSDDLQRFYNNKIAEGYSSKTVSQIAVIINMALEKAYVLRMIPENPNRFTTIPKKKKYEAKVLSMESVEKLVHEAKSEMLYPIVITTVYTGMRKGEVMALKWENVDFEGRRIHVKNSLCRVESDYLDEKGRRITHYELMEPKTKKSIRTIPMMNQVYDALREQQRRQNQDKLQYGDDYLDQGFVFADPIGRHLAQRDFNKEFKEFLGKYNIEQIRFHDLRHTFATLLIESDVSIKLVQELLGHSNITTSMDIYAHVSEKKKEQVISQLQDRTDTFCDNR